MLAGIAGRVAATPFADWAASSPYAYPAANVVHVLALVLLLGGIGLVDLRILGAFRTLPLQPLARSLVPIAATGVLILAASGSILFAADAVALAGNLTFRLKLVLIALAIANVALFRWRFGAVASRSPTAPRAAAGAGVAVAVDSVAIAGG